jgi:hypothetical protein
MRTFAYRVIIRYTLAMPPISEFYGIAVYIYYRDHNPPHFHAIYGESEAIIEISTGGILEGRLPRRAAKLVLNGARFNATRCSRTGLLHRHSSLYFPSNLWIDCDDFTYSPR